MKNFIYLICAVIATSTLAAQPQTKYSGVTYAVEVVRDNGSVTNVCMTFHESGQFTMSDNSLTMLWSHPINFANQFVAVTAPGQRSVVPYHQGVNGEVFADSTVKGRGIDQNGSAFQFRGEEKDDCYARWTEDMARNANQTAADPVKLPVASLSILDPCWTPPGYHVPCDPIPDPLRAGNPNPGKPGQIAPIRVLDPCQTADGSWTPCDPIPDPLRAGNQSPGKPGPIAPIRVIDPCQMADGSWTPCDPIPDPLRAGNQSSGKPGPIAPIRVLDPCQMADGSWTPCDPIPDPLRANVQNVTPSTLAGRSFRLTLGASDQSVLEYCWTFTRKRQIEFALLGRKGSLTWSPDISPHYDAGFISVGAGTNGQGMAYHGTLIGDDQLQVVGIEARDGKSLVSYGFGQPVASCK